MTTAKLVFTLALAGLLSGLALVGVYETTLPRINANKAAALRRAVFDVVPGAVSMQRLVDEGAGLVPNDTAPESTPAVYAAYDSTGSFIGYAIPGAGAGYQDTITLLYGFSPSRRQVIGMYVLDSRETPGLGDKIYKDANFVNEFRALEVDPEIVLVKDGSGGGNAVDAITGATISSTAVVKILNAANAEWLPRLPEAGQEPPSPQRGAGEGDSAANTLKGGR